MIPFYHINDLKPKWRFLHLRRACVLLLKKVGFTNVQIAEIFDCRLAIIGSDLRRIAYLNGYYKDTEYLGPSDCALGVLSNWVMRKLDETIDWPE